MNCSGCGRAMLRGGQKGGRGRPRRRTRPPEGYVWHEGRGMCRACLIRSRRLAPPDPYAKRRRAHVVEDTADLAQLGLTGDEIAARLRMTWDAIRLAHRRAGVPVPVAKNPTAHLHITRGEDVSRGTATVRPKRPARVA